MIRFRSCILARLISSPATSHGSPLLRLFSAAAPDFAVDDYLVRTCGLTRAQALKASPKLSHLKSPANPDAVLAFLAGLGLSAVAKDPLFLCAGVERTLSPVVAGLTGLGLSPSQIARLVSLGPDRFRCRSIVSRLHYYLSLFHSSEDLLRALKCGACLLSANLERVVKPNVAFLRECGLATCDIAKLCLSSRWMLTTNPERLRAMVACAQALGVPCGSAMFRHALRAIAFLSEEKITAKVDYLRKAFRWSDAQAGTAVSKLPMILAWSNGMMQSKAEFLISEVGLEPVYIAHHPAMLTYSLDGRLRPRYYVVKFLKENGLLDRDHDYYAAVVRTEKVFVKNYICPHKDAAPHLAEDYAAACRGQVPTRFRFA